MICKVTKKRVQNKKNLFFFMPSASNFGISANVTKKGNYGKGEQSFFRAIRGGDGVDGRVRRRAQKLTNMVVAMVMKISWWQEHCGFLAPQVRFFVGIRGGVVWGKP